MEVRPAFTLVTRPRRLTPGQREHLRRRIRRAAWNVSCGRRLAARILVSALFLGLLGGGIVSFGGALTGGVMDSRLDTYAFTEALSIAVLTGSSVLLPGAAVCRALARRRLAKELAQLPAEEAARTLESLRADILPDTQKILAPLVVRFCPPGTGELTPAHAPLGTERELSGETG